MAGSQIRRASSTQRIVCINMGIALESMKRVKLDDWGKKVEALRKVKDYTPR